MQRPSHIFLLSANALYLFSFFLLLRQTTCQQSGVTPCHDNKGGENAPECAHLVIPPGLCASCLLKPTLPNGHFANCKSIYNLDMSTPDGLKCLRKIQEYAIVNPCDTRRRFLITNLDDPSNGPKYEQQLDYFVYGLCEQCCDNIPKGSKKEEYESRLKNGELWSLKRGNGPAHFYFDVCNLVSNIKFLRSPWMEDKWEYPEVCPLLKTWSESDDAVDWADNFDVKMDERITRLLGDAMKALECDNKGTWTRCLELEAKQSRV